ALALGATRQAAGGPGTGRVDLPQRGHVAGALRVERADPGDEPRAVGREGQRPEPGEPDVGVEVVERRLRVGAGAVGVGRALVGTRCVPHVSYPLQRYLRRGT